MLQLVICLTCAGCSPLSCSFGVSCLVIKDEQLILSLIVPAHTRLTQMLDEQCEGPLLGSNGVGLQRLMMWLKVPVGHSEYWGLHNGVVVGTGAK